MRYYDFTLVTSAEQIKEKAKVNLREYGYGSPIAALNCYMDKNTKNDVKKHRRLRQWQICPKPYRPGRTESGDKAAC